MVPMAEERLQEVAAQTEVGESEREHACLHWLWQRSVLNLQRPDVELELWA